MLNKTSKLLLLEDEVNLGSTLKERLTGDGFEVSWSESLGNARKSLMNQHFDLAILDVGLPDGTGFDFATELRNASPTTATVFLTALDSPQDRVRGLELGAEDYMVKPFIYKELLLRIQNILRRTNFLLSAPSDGVKIGRSKISFSGFFAEQSLQDSSGSIRIELTHKETALLKLLYEKRGTAVSRDDILNQIWSADEYPSPRTIDNFILKLRKVIEIDPEDPQIIRSIRGVGYQLNLPTESRA